MSTLNIFGLFFSFMIPGMILGFMGGYIVYRTNRLRALTKSCCQEKNLGGLENG